MAILTPEQWTSLLAPYLADAPTPALLLRLDEYLNLLLRWNARMNLTAIRKPENIVRRHFGESLFLARHLPAYNVPRGTFTLLDHGSGAGFPGLPVALARPEIVVTLAESQIKKAVFLREAVRVTGAANVEVYCGRTEALPSERLFDCLTLRAVDDAATAYPIAAARVRPGGSLAALEAENSPAGTVLVAAGWNVADVWPVPESGTVLRLYNR